MFAYRDTVSGSVAVHVAFTDARTSLHDSRENDGVPFEQRLADLSAHVGHPVQPMHQVHGAEIVTVTEPVVVAPPCDGLMTGQPDLGLLTRVADCVPILMADADRGLVAAVHAGRPGLAAGVVEAALDAFQRARARPTYAWIGPHVCGRCYEVPEEMRAAFVAARPAADSETSWGTPALDLGAEVTRILTLAEVEVRRVPGCTKEDSRWHSYRRDGAAAGRAGGVIWWER